MIEVEIDGQKVDVPAGTTILTVARSPGIDIPTLSHHEALQLIGACHLCLVALEENGRQSIVAACNYPLERSGLVVNTDTPAVRQAREMSLRLLLARCPTVKVLQDLALEWEVSTGGLLLTGDGGEECILCGLCVRVCREVMGRNVISFPAGGKGRFLFCRERAGAWTYAIPSRGKNKMKGRRKSGSGKALTEGANDVVGAAFAVETDPHKAAALIMDHIRSKRDKLGLP